MKSWLAKMRISGALDGGPKLPGPLRERIGSSEELRDFAQRLAVVDHALRATAPRPRAPASLHRLIMRAVERGERPAAAWYGPALLRWLAVPAVAVVALLLAWYCVRGPARPPAPERDALVASASALEIGGRIAQAIPSAVVAPLADELERLSCDLNNAGKYLLASLP